ncbi:MAG TPA: tetratricopeptide repeat protein [Steroidobacteraceae bacterium]|nr:tetratricopeptide repeat protein [Steroidobacteraceae bacterium]
MGSYLGLSIASIIIQIGLIVHCIRTGRSFLWVWVLLALPGVGSIAYVLVEILPGLLGSRGARRAARGVSRALNPEQDLRRYEAEARHTGDVASRQRYADELLRHDRAGDAVEVYKQTLKGLYEHDPNLMLGLARAQFANGAFAEARSTLDALIEHNPDFKSPDGHLLYARALEGEGNRDKALEEYAAVAGYYAGAEAKLRYARLLSSLGKKEDSRRILKELLEHARFAPRHYRKMQQQWLADAERELASL